MDAKDLVTTFLVDALVISGDQAAGADVLAAWTGRDSETIADAQTFLALVLNDVGATRENYMLLFGAWLALNKPEQRSQQ